jgi:hypothetical protein
MDVKNKTGHGDCTSNARSLLFFQWRFITLQVLEPERVLRAPRVRALLPEPGPGPEPERVRVLRAPVSSLLLSGSLRPQTRMS